MKEAKITLLTTGHHVSQLLTGFTLLKNQGIIDIAIENQFNDYSVVYPGAMVLVHYCGKTLIYDMYDGYQQIDAIKYYLDICDFYFKRSFSADKNRKLCLNWEGKMFPLGLFYHVSCQNHPTDKQGWKEQIKSVIGIENAFFRSTFFSSKRFEEMPKQCKYPRVLFLTRLWGEDEKLDIETNKERRFINETRIEIIRTMREIKGDFEFIGGLPDSSISRELAPDLIMPPELTDRRRYLQCMHGSDICIGSMGLHQSIGGKTGEYVAASKAIVNEKLHYSVPGDFAAGKNYLEFETAEQCLSAVRFLVDNPDKMMEMKKANREYYLNFLRPDVLVQNTLDIVDRHIQGEIV